MALAIPDRSVAPRTRRAAMAFVSLPFALMHFLCSGLNGLDPLERNTKKDMLSSIATTDLHLMENCLDSLILF
jgi:hypothetical protein